MSKLLEGTSTVSKAKKEEKDLDTRVSELVKTIEGIGEPFFQPIIITNKLGLEQIENEFNEPNRILPKGMSKSFMNVLVLVLNVLVSILQA